MLPGAPMQAPWVDAILQNGGDMGALARQTGWARTPLGPVTAWPQSLRSVAGLVLASHFPMYLAWGPEYTQLYNDAYRPILGSSKHPAAMGASAAETFAESWHIIGPMFDDVRRGIACASKDWMLPLDRNGYLEECFFTFSYSPVLDESGGVGGVHVTVVETTEIVLEARRLQALQALSDCMTRAPTTPEGVCVTALTVLEAYREDVPFALIYLLPEDGQAARLVARMGLEEGAPESVPVIPVLRDGDGWPLHRVSSTGQMETVTDLGARFGPLPGGPWPEPARAAVVLPIRDPERERPYALLIVGISPRRALDPSYRDFFSRVAGKLAAGMTSARVVAADRWRAEEDHAIVEAERNRLYGHFIQAPFPIAILRGAEYTIELANSAVLEIWGKKPTIVGQPLLAALPEIIGQPFIGFLDGVRDTGIAYEGKEELARLARGPSNQLEDVFLNFVYSPLRAHGGEIEGILVCGFEVTSQVLARRALEQALAEAARLSLERQEADALFRALGENLPELAWSALPDGYIDFYNHRWYAYTGMTFEQMEGWGWKAVHDPGMLDEVTRRWMLSLTTGERFEMEFPLRGADGVFRWFLTRVEPLRDARGRIVRWFGTNADIDDAKRLREELEERTRFEQHLLGIVSHDLRNPLGAILLGATALLELAESGEVTSIARRVHASAERSTRMITDLLDFTQARRGGRIPLKRRAVDLHDVAIAAIHETEAMFPERVVEVTREGEVRGTWDADRLAQVITNLVTNALKYGNSGTFVAVHLVGRRETVELTVHNQGTPIPAERLGQIFEPLQRATDTIDLKTRSVGLGLYIVDAIVKAHEGTVSVVSTVDAGTTFSVLLPRESEA